MTDPQRMSSSAGHQALVPETSKARHEALQARHAGHLADIVARLETAVSALTTRISELEAVERRQNVPLLSILILIFFVLLYCAILLSHVAHHFA